MHTLRRCDQLDGQEIIDFTGQQSLGKYNKNFSANYGLKTQSINNPSFLGKVNGFTGRRKPKKINQNFLEKSTVLLAEENQRK